MIFFCIEINIFNILIIHALREKYQSMSMMTSERETYVEKINLNLKKNP